MLITSDSTACPDFHLTTHDFSESSNFTYNECIKAKLFIKYDDS